MNHFLKKIIYTLGKIIFKIEQVFCPFINETNFTNVNVSIIKFFYKSDHEIKFEQYEKKTKKYYDTKIKHCESSNLWVLGTLKEKDESDIVLIFHKFYFYFKKKKKY